MKTLILLRHGKAQAESPTGDRGRTLAERGEIGAALAGQSIRKAVGEPHLVITSPAARAHDTALIASAVLRCVDRVQIDDDIYDASVSALYEVLGRAPKTCETLLLVGHNPGFEDLTDSLHHRNNTWPTLSPGAFAHLALDIGSWAEAQPGCAKLCGIWTPPKHA